MPIKIFAEKHHYRLTGDQGCKKIIILDFKDLLFDLNLLYNQDHFIDLIDLIELILIF